MKLLLHRWLFIFCFNSIVLRSSRSRIFSSLNFLMFILTLLTIGSCGGLIYEIELSFSLKRHGFGGRWLIDLFLWHVSSKGLEWPYGSKNLDVFFNSAFRFMELLPLIFYGASEALGLPCCCWSFWMISRESSILRQW